jgi:two-component system, chemotaxis family, sensor kinase CheA
MMDSEIGRQIREEASELLAEMEAALLELENKPQDSGLINRVFRAMHTIKGAANMFGLNEVAALTHEVETVFDKVRSGEFACSRELLDFGFQARDLIWELIESPEAVDATSLETVKAAFKALACGGMKTRPLTEVPPADAPEPEAPREQAQEVEEKTEPTAYAVTFKPTASNAMVHADPLGILDELRELGECHVALHGRDVPELEGLEPESCALWWEILVVTDKNENALRDVFIFVEDASELRIESVADPEAWRAERALAPMEEELFPAPDIPEPVAPEAEVAASPESEVQPAVEPEQQDVCTASPSVSQEPETHRPIQSAARAATPPVPKAADQPCKPAATPRREAPSSVRVDAFKLDDMVALVGELVIAQAKLSQLAGTIAEPNLQSVAEEIELLSGSLRDRTLSMRMLPIGTTFDRFRRLVRDLSHELGKEIELVTQGAETELDKTVIEQLGDPLVHLLRNSIDHGIESPAEREAAGKPRKGTLVLSAEHSGGHVLIRIFDNGKGMDRDKLAVKGVERGLITDPDSMSNKDIFNLVFHPGFSMAEKVTNVSGRGVGMDVVKRGIEALRGSVDIDSTKDVGTTITVKLPLTLAIIEGLQVRVGDEFFVIPLAAVQECVELTAEERGESNGDGKRIINLRNEIVPFIRLREWFDVPGENPEIEQIIIAGDDNQRTGIVVDEVVGQQQTVIKSLGKVFRNVEEFSGATIKGDGTMALILDVPNLVRKVMKQCAEAEAARP